MDNLNNTTLNITEIFYSLQGEAKEVGIPTVFGVTQEANNLFENYNFAAGTAEVDGVTSAFCAR